MRTLIGNQSSDVLVVATIGKEAIGHALRAPLIWCEVLYRSLLCGGSGGHGRRNTWSAILPFLGALLFLRLAWLI